ncbi:hypothetical protein HLB44_35160 [Aquincola sp. S2]|uniref:DUF4132 domain-containing protein n=1 Tax=Pseudaquabacterium terrae TaxID=2732868 RepID=A0ABX2EUB3_9BURK|nr:hypothetical protein [Aquabacterium terrae]NRF72237.1 hypothetical protein [Aquabacterium terrae]
MTSGLDAAVAPFDEPHGGFQWTEELRATLPVVRGIRVMPLPDAEAMVDAPIGLPADFGPYRLEIELLNAQTGGTWAYWGPVRGDELIRRDHLARADRPFWTDLCVQLAVARIDGPNRNNRYFYRYGLQWATEVGIHLHGLPFMAELVLELARRWRGSTPYRSVVESMLPPLRAAVAAAGDGAHAELLAALERLGETTPLDRLLRAHLCPHREDWALASLADGDDPHGLLAHCVLPPAAAREYLNGRPALFSDVEQTMLLQIHLHGEQAFPLLADLLGHAHDYRQNRESQAAFVARMQVPQLPALLAALMARKEVRAELDRLAERYPAAALKAVIEHAQATESREAEGWAVRLALRQPDALAQALPALSGASRERFELLLATFKVSEAAPEKLPAVLREPPWLRKARTKPLPTLEIAPPAHPDRLTWGEAERLRHTSFVPSSRRPNYAAKLSDLDYALIELRIKEAARQRVLAGEPLQAADALDDPLYSYGVSLEVVLLLPDAASLAVWNSYPASRWSVWRDTSTVVHAILAKFGDVALPGLANFAAAHPEAGLRIASIADSTRIAPIALHALRHLKKARPLAIDWLRAHAPTALAAALPQAFGNGKAAREDAQHGLRWFVASGLEAEARAVAATYGDAMAQALQALLDADPLLVLPARLPKLPAFFVAPALHRHAVGRS